MSSSITPTRVSSIGFGVYMGRTVRQRGSAAIVDGASPWQRFWRITLPLLRPAIAVALVFRTLLQTVLATFALVVQIVGAMFPAIWPFLTSMETDDELVRQPITYLPDAATLAAYVEVFEENPFARFLLNSIHRGD